jgi:tetratricopeptide (TPR) repeat protein
MIRARRCKSRISHALAGALVLAVSSAASAQSSEADRAAAEVLFKTARELVQAGKFAEACPKFEASIALYESASTAVNLADCLQQVGKLATASGYYGRALALSRGIAGDERRAKLERLAREGIASLEPRLPKLRVLVMRPLEGFTVLRDGKELPLGSLIEALPMDPGGHDVRVSAPGYATVSRFVMLEEGKTTTVEISLQPVGAPAPAPAPVPAAPPPDRRSGVPVWAWATGGAGLALLGTSAYFLADDLAAIHALRTRCSTTSGVTTCDPGYDYGADNARKNRDLPLFIGLGGAGVIAVGAAVVGIVRASSAPAKAAIVPWIAPGLAGVSLAGGFQ